LRTLPSWMYEDPAEVAERIQNGERRALARQLKPEPEPCTMKKPNYGLVSEATIRLIKRARIRELVRSAMKARR